MATSAPIGHCDQYMSDKSDHSNQTSQPSNADVSTYIPILRNGIATPHGSPACILRHTGLCGGCKKRIPKRMLLLDNTNRSMFMVFCDTCFTDGGRYRDLFTNGMVTYINDPDEEDICDCCDGSNMPGYRFHNPRGSGFDVDLESYMCLQCAIKSWRNAYRKWRKTTVYIPG